MAKNTGKDYRRGEVKDRSQVLNPKTGDWTKRDAENGRFMDGKKGKPFKVSAMSADSARRDN